MPGFLPRRRFLATVAAPVLASLAASCRRPAALPDDPTVVIGAGLAGLRTAELLVAAGASVIVLEASRQPGGRVRTDRSFADGLYGEAGARRISGAHARVLQLVKDRGLTLMPYASAVGSAVITVAGRTLRTPDDLPQAARLLRLSAGEAGLSQGELLEKYAGDAVAAFRESAAETVPPARWHALDRTSWPEWLASRGASPGAVTMITLGGDSRALSALYVLRLASLLSPSDQFYKIEGGMDQLPRKLAVGLGDRVRYGAAVVRVEHDASAVRVEYRQGDRLSVLRARRVVFAIPFPTLRQVRLQPGLSEPKARAVAELPYFPGTRFLLESTTRFWDADGLNGSARTDDPAEMWDGTYETPADGGVLGATVGGAIGDAMGPLTDAEALRRGVALVSTTFPRLQAEFRQGTVVRWAREPWAQGAFAVFHPGQMTTLLPALAGPEGRLHFAGEHTSPWTGWMEGALESAERVAGEVAAA